ncbi:hypothetical protein KKB54_04135 [bacterium]|nr:hypothetical protein [bacterium]
MIFEEIFPSLQGLGRDILMLDSGNILHISYKDVQKYCLDKKIVKEIINDNLQHDSEPDGINGRNHNENKKKAYIYDDRCSKCRIMRELGL